MKTPIFKEEDLRREAEELLSRVERAGRCDVDLLITIKPFCADDAPHDSVYLRKKTIESEKSYAKYVRERKKLARSRKR